MKFTFAALAYALPLLASAQSASTTTSAAPAATSSSANLTKWDWNSSTQQRMHGVALGNWLLLEKWMSWNWFETTCGNDTAADEWSWMVAVGNETRAVELLTDHWNDWVTDDDIATIAASGFNHLRIPIGYWAWIPQPSGDTSPYAFQSGQVEQLTRILAACQANGIYALIDLHGLPGSQNGEQASGHQGYNNFYQPANQALGDQTFDAIISYIEASPYRSVISGVENCNEPVYYTADQFDTLMAYDERCYEKITNMTDPVPLLFHPGSPNSNPLGSWTPFIAGKDPSLLVFTIHPYIGRGASLTGTAASETDLINQLCSVTASYETYGVPVALTEWSLINPIVNNSQWDTEWFTAQTAEYAKSGGGIFWAWQTNSTGYDGTEIITFYQYSLKTLLERNLVPLPAAGQSTSAYLASLDGPCNSTAATTSWASPVAAAATSTSTGGAQRRNKIVWHESL